MEFFPGQGWTSRAILSVARAVSRASVTGLDQLPARDPVLLVVNHVGLLGPLLPSVLGREVVFLASTLVLRTPVLGRLIRAYGGLFISPADMLSNGLVDHARRILASGALLAVMLDGQEMTLSQGIPKRGAAFLASKLQVELLPVEIRFGPLGQARIALKERVPAPAAVDRATLNRVTARLSELLGLAP